jgi:hypothetical protein
MKKRTKLALAAGAAVAVVGAGGALAAAKLSPSEESKAVVEDAAAQLGVEPAELTAALKQALKNRVDAAVEAGRLTESQGTELKQRIEEDEFPALGGHLFGHQRGPGHHFQHAARVALDTAATYLGVTEAELRASLRDGQSLADVAKAEGKSVDGLVDALVREATERLDQAVEDGKLTDAQRDELAEHLEEAITAAVNAEPPAGFGFRGFGGHGRHGPPPPGGDA